jgi:DNA polymerase-3 subunit gamma/tau
VTTALYRRYRPDTFADVVGQEHVTVPLMQALRADKVNHAYLFSGPRGCGKTTSARILARCLNCAQGPTDTPCGECDSCLELSRGGTGSVDVVEIDAASHNGVDDARELRERAAFAPARDRFKIFILDEAHMVTTQGFNALLKLVEEPPPHVRFIFATTEPEKVIGTIRSRTHHYPFRLVPPPVLTEYLQKLCDAEGVKVASGVLPLVVRAGGGSVRDSLSVLDQLMAGSGKDGVTYEGAIALLGFTDATMLDDAIDAIAAADGASLFGVVSRVIATGHEPRRFVEDLLERLRDLLVLAASGESGAKALGALPEDQLARMREQARVLGLTRASRAADLVNDALTSMVGAAAPRLHLELLCARLIAADVGHPAPASGHPAPKVAVPPAPERAPVTEAVPVAEAPVPPAPAPTGAVASGSEDAELIRRRWQEVLGTLERHRVTWAMVSQSAIVTSVDGGVLRLTFDNAPLAGRFAAGDHSENVALAVRETLGLHVRVEAATGPAAAEPAHTVSAGVATATGMTPVVTAAAKPVAPSGRTRPAAEPPPPDEPEPYDEISDDDATDAQGQLTGAEAVAKLLGGTVVES